MPRLCSATASSMGDEYVKGACMERCLEKHASSSAIFQDGSENLAVSIVQVIDRIHVHTTMKAIGGI